MIKFIIRRQSGYAYRGDDNYVLGHSLGVPLEDANDRKRAQDAYEHTRDTHKKTDRYTSFSLSKILAAKFTKRDKIIKIALQTLYKLEAEGRIKILDPEEVSELIRSSGKKRIRTKANSLKEIMAKNSEILIEGEIPYIYNNDVIIVKVK